jgi:hypothetical protein
MGMVLVVRMLVEDKMANAHLRLNATILTKCFKINKKFDVDHRGKFFKTNFRALPCALPTYAGI